MKTAIYIGMEKGTIKAISDALVLILQSGQEQETIRTAINCFGGLVKVENVTITGCPINITEHYATPPEVEQTSETKSGGFVEVDHCPLCGGETHTYHADGSNTCFDCGKKFYVIKKEETEREE